MDHPEETEPECRHDWHYIDLSFDHAFGTEHEGVWECELCGEQSHEKPKELYFV